ncbi:HAD family hydrolase [Glycomyces sp. MUSA5-2]|uniref:HAD family hydrolase n=1 Tax=Glycomyces sp. MUSA5-2 TaxID=2053002 RepID=UPI0030080063
MSTSQRPVVSLDIGGTLGGAQGPGIAARLSALSPLTPKEARRIMRGILHTAPTITPSVIGKVCAALEISPRDFPSGFPVSPLVLFDGVPAALRRLSQRATVVTISNVTCAEVDTERLEQLFAPWVSTHFPSCHTGFAKPDPEAFINAASVYQLAASDLIHVGDDWECDILGARAVNATVIWISHGRTPPNESPLVTNDVHVAENFTDAVQYICRLLETRNA